MGSILESFFSASTSMRGFSLSETWVNVVILAAIESHDTLCKRREFQGLSDFSSCWALAIYLLFRTRLDPRETQAWIIALRRKFPLCYPNSLPRASRYAQQPCHKRRPPTCNAAWVISSRGRPRPGRPAEATSDWCASVVGGDIAQPAAKQGQVARAPSVRQRSFFERGRAGHAVRASFVG